MPQPISDYLVGDAYAPTVPKPSLQQYDNYQIYSIVSEDIIYPGEEVTDIINTNIVAFQTYDISGEIPVDFKQYINNYY
jgi:hypothetical protein